MQSSLLGLINFILDVLIIGAIIHWLLGFFQSAYQPSINAARNFLDRLYNPLLESIRSVIPPISLSKGNALDLSPLILIILLIIAKKLATYIL